MFPQLNLPKATLKITQKENQFFVWCVVRKKQLILTPEEWVRQHVLHFLLNERNVALGRINSEHLIPINGQKRRCDLVVVDQFGQPLLIVECKATHVPIDEKTFLQTSNYVRETNASFFWMTNGLHHVIMQCGSNPAFLADLPELNS